MDESAIITSYNPAIGNSLEFYNLYKQYNKFGTYKEASRHLENSWIYLKTACGALRDYEKFNSEQYPSLLESVKEIVESRDTDKNTKKYQEQCRKILTDAATTELCLKCTNPV